MNTPESLAEGVLKGNIRALARSISAVENASPSALPLMKLIFPHTGRAQVIGLTGSPGAGKSSLTDKLAQVYRTRGHRVGIIAVDPSSPFSGGAILGDRIRMQNLATDPGIFIRSMATRGNLGGLARATADAVLLFDAAGYETIIVETVGVGQDEVDIVKTADVTIVVLVPGMGDDVQSIKAGIMEIGDVFVINKADRDGADRTQMELESLLSLAMRHDFWQSPIVRTVATRNEGLDELVEAIEKYAEFTATNPTVRHSRQERVADQKLLELVRDRALAHIRNTIVDDGEWHEWTKRIAAREQDPYSVAETILKRIFG
jgi:LAO/AO transport system kinase